MDTEKPSAIETRLGLEFGKHFKRTGETKYVPVAAYWESPYRGWWYETLLAIKSGQFAKDLEARLKTMREIFERARASSAPSGG